MGGGGGIPGAVGRPQGLIPSPKQGRVCPTLLAQPVGSRVWPGVTGVWVLTCRSKKFVNTMKLIFEQIFILLVYTFNRHLNPCAFSFVSLLVHVFICFFCPPPFYLVSPPPSNFFVVPPLLHFCPS